LGRQKTAELLHAPSPEQVTFTQSVTDALHIIADDLARSVPGPGDEIVPRVLDHHSNIIPCLQACEMTAARIRVAPITLEGDVKLDALERLLPDRKRVVSVSLVSYALGTAVPVARTAEIARARGAGVVIDGAQAKPPLPVNVKEIGCTSMPAAATRSMARPASVSSMAGGSGLTASRRWKVVLTIAGRFPSRTGMPSRHRRSSSPARRRWVASSPSEQPSNI
jgi:cysteine desulfurase/selenocysteine lyase